VPICFGFGPRARGDGKRRYNVAPVFACVIAIVSSATPISTWAQALHPEVQVTFDIPSQSLADALRRYGDLTGREALYDASLADGRVSGALDGQSTPDDALRRLLTGTGLYARFVTETAFVLLPLPADAAPTQTQFTPPRYYGLIQDTLLDALCKAGARPGSYRMLLVFQIGATGQIEAPQRIGSTGATEVDQLIDATLRRVRLSEAPPPNFAQPVSILLVPQAPGVTPGCRTRAREGNESLHEVGTKP
jgi:hypothetical protein